MVKNIYTGGELACFPTTSETISGQAACVSEVLEPSGTFYSKTPSLFAEKIFPSLLRE